METWKSISSHTTEYENPIKLSKGEIVKLGDFAPEENWKNWIWAENNKQQGGWVPIQIIDKGEDNKTGIILEDYSAKELNIDINEIVVKVKSLNGWSWVRKTTNNDEGWIPDEVIEVYING
jgi:hypothetical protein